MRFYCSTATLVNQNYIIYINMKQDTDKLKKIQVGDVRVCVGGQFLSKCCFKYDYGRIFR